ncbi:MAG TPA: hypothetical protein VFG04_19180 [Planctomycetaceae bacterium]|nr:hypothetical protein [Planctomycetaceae bacterium]
MRYQKWIRGFIGALILTALCVIAAARIIEWQDRPQPIRGRWPHMNASAMVAVLAPAAVFWFVYFAYYWRGRALAVQCRRLVAKCGRSVVTHPVKSFLWLVIVVELSFFFLVAISSPAVH